jgi:hypothetical protein
MNVNLYAVQGLKLYNVSTVYVTTQPSQRAVVGTDRSLGMRPDPTVRKRWLHTAVV